MNATHKIPVWLYSLFWDVNPDEVDLLRNSVLVIERLLNEGDQRALSWLFKTYTEDKIREAVLHSRSLSLKTARCWQNYFNLREEEVRCFGMYSTSPAGIY
jgi:hypothetical protein